MANFHSLLYVLCCFLTAAAGSVHLDVDALMAFKKAVTYDPNGALHNWTVKNAQSPCNWTGILCNTRKWRVVGIDLTNMSLEGSIPPQLGNLSFLHYMYLAYNRIGGHIPWELGRLRRLKQLQLQGNVLEGPIPASLGACLSLTELRLSKNRLNGSIPQDLGSLRNLQLLTSWKNLHTGVIPWTLGNCSMLKLLDLSENSLKGTIPSDIGSLSKLEVLALEQNHLSGEIPASLLNCSELRNLSLVNNSLTGPIPSEIGFRLTKLELLLLPLNKLNGLIPKSLGNCSRLSILELAWNELSGVIPQELGNLLRLRVLVLFFNRFVSGSASTIPILDALTNCSMLTRLDITHNLLQGRLPPSVGLLSPILSTFSLEGNVIKGEIPEEIGNLTGLTELYLSNNFFEGTIPSTIARLSNLRVLNLSMNSFQGPLPIELGRMKSLENIFLYKNELSGEIPKTLGNLQLRQLDLSINKLHEEVPQELGRCANLELVDVSYNQLTGTIPLEVASLRNLQLYFNLSNNKLTGRVPGLLGGMQMVQAIDLSYNKLSGSVPNGLSSCAGLQYLNLSYNQLDGLLPASFGNGLESLEDIDLSFNKLSGQLPGSLSKVKNLVHLNFSYNQLSGAVPSVGAYRKQNVSSFLGNPLLCGKWLGLPDCSSRKLKRDPDHALKWKIPLLVSVVSVSVFSCLGLVIWVYCIRKKTGLLKTLGQLPKASREDLSRATGGFNCRNIIGIGSLGSVYRGVLSDGKAVAIKVIASRNREEADASFERECKALLKVGHPNLLKIISVCSDADLKALVLEFMPNGSLYNCLHAVHSDDDENRPEELSLRKRMVILCEVACGVSYLHHHCSPPIVHCDLKPQNVLLDENMRARVADFGIAQILSASDEAATMTSTLRGSIGYIPPEYGVGGRISTKGDVYSYGVLVLEILTQKMPTDPMFSGGLTLSGWVSDSFPYRLKDVIAQALLTEISGDSNGHGELIAEGIITSGFSTVQSLAQVGLRCTCHNPEQRPSMAEVVKMLQNITHNFTMG